MGPASVFAEGRVKTVDLPRARLAVGRAADGFFAVDDTCPHAGASLGEGLVDGDLLVCPLHAYAYHLRSGRCEEDGSQVRTYAVRVESDQLEVELPLPD